MDFFTLINSRESCRKFDPTKKVTHEQLIKCIEAANIAPSACNSQPWSFIVAESEESVKLVREGVQKLGGNKFTDNAAAFICVVEEQATLSARVVEAFSHQHFAGYDIGIAVAHIILAAREQGLSTCVLGWFNEEKLKKDLGVSAKKKLPLVIAVGYAENEELRPKTRKKIENIVKYI